MVKTDEGKCVECKIKGNFRLKGIRSTNPVAVGDNLYAYKITDDASLDKVDLSRLLSADRKIQIGRAHV